MKKRSGSLLKLDKKIKERRKVSNEYSQRRNMKLENFYSSAKNLKSKKMAEHERELFAVCSSLEFIQSSWLRLQSFKKQTKLDEAMKEVENIIWKVSPEFEASKGQISVLQDKQA
jgi:hypothetical protein